MLAVSLSPLVVGGGCETGGRQTSIAGGRQGQPSAMFAPVRIRVHPLTRLGRDSGGRAMIVCHLEVKDRWGDTVKGAGVLQVTMYRTGLGAVSGQEEQERRWEVDLRDPEVNASLYDPATRTYRVQLGGLPEWVEQMAPRDEGTGGAGRLRLRAVFETVGPDGRQAFLRDELLIER